MSKKYLIIVLGLLILVLVGGGYYFWKTRLQKPIDVSPVVDKGIVNPAEDTQGVNPYDKTNPFSNIKVNPFE